MRTVVSNGGTPPEPARAGEESGDTKGGNAACPVGAFHHERAIRI